MTLPPLWIDRNNPIPFYLQVEEKLVEAIEQGEWPVGAQLPGEMELCQLFGVSRTVIRQALNELSFKGLIHKHKGKGTFVASSKISEGLVQDLTGFFQDMQARGRTPSTQVLEQMCIPAGAKIAAHLQLAPGDPVIKIHRLRFLDGEPMILDVTYIPYVLCPELLNLDLTHQSLYAFLESRGLALESGHRTIEAVAANEVEAGLLQVEKGAPLLLLESVTFLGDHTPIEYYYALHRGDRSKLEVKLTRNHFTTQA